MANEVVITVKAHDQASATVASAAGKISTSLGGIAKFGLLGLGGLVAGVGAVGIGFDNMKQQATIAFTTMLGSGAKAKAFLDDLQDFAQKTPFEFPDLIKGSQRLMAMGFAAKDVRPTLTAVGDAVAGLGGGAEMIGRVTTALGQMKAKGKVSAEEMNQLSEAGIPGWAMIAEKIGKSIPEAMKLAEKGAINADTAIGALTEGMNKKFGGMMEKQSHTFGGLLSTLKDTFTQASGQIVGPFFEKLTGQMQRLADFTNSPEFQNGIKEFAEKLADGLDKAANAAQKFGDVIIPVLSTLEPGDIGLVAAAIGVGLVAAFVAGTIAAMSFWTAVSLGLAVAIPALILGITLLVRNWDTVWEHMKAAPMALVNWLKNNWMDALLAGAGPIGWVILLAKHWKSVFDAMPGPVQSAMNAVAGIVSTAINKMIDMINALTSGLNKLGAIGERIGLGFSIGAIPHVGDFQQFGGFGAKNNMATDMADLATALDPAAWERLAAVIPEVEKGLGGSGGGGGGLAGALAEVDTGLADLAAAFDAWHAQTGGALSTFLALIQVEQDKAALDVRAMQASIGLQAAQMEALDGSFQLKKGLVAIAEKAIELGGSLPRAIEFALKGMVDNIRNAFNGLFNRPTKEGAELDLEIAIKEEQLANQKATGASEDETMRFVEQIASLRLRKDLLVKHANVLKAQIELADHTLLTEQGRDFAATLYTIALGDASAQLDAASALVSLQGIAQANYITALNNAAGAVGGSTDPFNAAEKYWINGVARGRGEPEPFPGFDTGGRVTRTGLALVHAGEEFRPAGKAPLDNASVGVAVNFHGPVTINARDQQEAERSAGDMAYGLAAAMRARGFVVS